MKYSNIIQLVIGALLLSACATQPLTINGGQTKNTPSTATVQKEERNAFAFSDEFVLAVKMGDTATVKNLVAKGAPINLHDKNGIHLAIHAVQSNNPALVDFLASRGMDLNGYGSATYTPISLAVSKSPEMVSVFIKHGANLDNISENSSSYGPAISWGIQKQKTKNVIKLINAGADVNALDSFGVPPILYAFNHQDIPVMKLIFKKGGNPNYIDPNGNSLVAAAIMMRSLTLLKVLAEAKADFSKKDLSGKTPLSQAIAVGNPQIVEFLKKQLGIT